MDNHNNLNDILEILQTEKENVSALGENNATKMGNLLDNLIETTKELNHQNIEKTIVVGDYVTLKMEREGNIQYSSVYLGYDFNAETISLLSPVGSKIYGKKVGNIVTCKVNDVLVTVQILSKNIDNEKKEESGLSYSLKRNN